MIVILISPRELAAPAQSPAPSQYTGSKVITKLLNRRSVRLLPRHGKEFGGNVVVHGDTNSEKVKSFLEKHFKTARSLAGLIKRHRVEQRCF